VTSRSRLGKRSKGKGRAWERALVRLLKPIFGEDVHRGHQDNRGGVAAGEGCDCEGTPFWVEAKHEKATSPLAALRQCREAQAVNGDERPIVAVCKDDRKPKDWRPGQPMEPPIAVMELTDWLDLVADWARLKRDAGELMMLPLSRRNCR
jgi:hypothetical protein